ncbi:MAG: FtsL-like putative cell division protein [Bacteroidales bacterium]|nr:FtsL-like putative cell division protein [Bacteroidales bacterium]
MKKIKNFFSSYPKNQKEKEHPPLRRNIKYFVSGRFLESESIRKNLPFILFITLLFVIYIYNSYKGDKKRLELENRKRQILLLKSENIAAKTLLISYTKYGQALKSAQAYDLKPTDQLPFKIFVPDTSLQKK